MGKIHAIVGANYGDEGKGKIVDLLTRYADYQKAPTYLADSFLFNPVVLMTELKQVMPFGELVVNPDCRVTTPFDMMANQTNTLILSHGSCGMGIFNTIRRDEVIPFRAYEVTIDNFKGIVFKLDQIFKYYKSKYIGFDMSFVKSDLDSFKEKFLEDIDEIYGFYNLKSDIDIICSVPSFENFIFESGQGLRLSQGNLIEFPNLTPSNTGLTNVVQFCLKNSYSLEEITPYYITRPYLTRHGNGRLENEWDISFPDSTNMPNPFQGELRFGMLNLDTMLNFIENDMSILPNTKFNMVVNCFDHITHFTYKGEEHSTLDLPKILGEIENIKEIFISGVEESVYYKPKSRGIKSGIRRRILPSI